MDIRQYIIEKDKQLFKSKWHDIQVTKNGFEYDKGIPGVAILPFRLLKDKSSPFYNFFGCPVEFLIRKEHSEIQPDKPATIITGRKDSGENDLKTAIRELKEESGYQAPAFRFKNLGKLYISKGSPTQDTFFCVNLTGISRGEITTDGTSSEALSRNIWVSLKEIEKYVKNSKCVYLNTAYSKWKEAYEVPDGALL